MAFDVVDTQVHLGPESYRPALAEMDALGIRSVLIEEYWYASRADYPSDMLMPGFALPNGAWRALFPTAQIASLLHPDRFAYIARVDRRDPALEAVMRQIADHPGARAFRVLATRTPEETAAFAAGGFDALFAIAEDIGLPVNVYSPGHVEHLARYPARFPRLRFAIDHMGMNVRGARGAPSAAAEPAYFDTVLRLAEHPNVALKLGHAPMLFDAGDFPFAAVRPHLRRAIAAFGADRIMWASDQGIIPHYRWRDLLAYLRDDPEFSDGEKAAILGGTARRFFDWPATVRVAEAAVAA